MKVNDLVAVYGSLRAGLGNHRTILGVNRLDDGIISDKFSMVSLGGFPGLIKSETTTPIVVEVYEIDTTDRIRALDMLEGYRPGGGFYDREQVELEDGRICWVYFLPVEGYSTYSPVSSGDWKEYKGY